MTRARLYFDDDSAQRALLNALENAGMDAVTPEKCGTTGFVDERHLEFASANGRVLVTANRGDFMRLHWAWLASERQHGGIVISNREFGIGERARRLLRLDAISAEDCVNRLEFLTDWGE